MTKYGSTYNGCLVSGFFSVFCVLMLLATCTSSCSSARVTALVPAAEVISRDGDRLLIQFEDAAGAPGRAYEWFHFPGLGPVDYRSLEAELVIRKRRGHD
ncbi:hypothetical protein SAMN05192553_102703 [Cyclobacterium xiamenense]|uniref:Uncharacterized protein n=1 Tax=Cyclobacterium xiamenense TaxID=1297121 RepID=A0A1H6WGZ7_9BACT|nr:hypothetical protein [Cyclobacterium xiamenense]SEJ16301.1 hypothetical protein SAMN05192553_102703 [Cyclobacterium xiamenense]